jgi:2-polyprenyl-3-methyl-5-hydroxy-6-metoxy-1,4-benzoquinol methylase
VRDMMRKPSSSLRNGKSGNATGNGSGAGSSAGTQAPGSGSSAAHGGEGRKARLLVFVIAYHAETTLRKVLERIPRSLFTRFDAEILVVDDASADRTFEIGVAYRDAHPEIALTVLRNEYNQGYGGNQKVGYSFAIKNGFDVVAMVHGDGQYAPEELPKLVEPLLAGEADAVFGSRMMTRFGALEGGMPLYKYIGNKVLTTAQNTLLGSNLSEFHSGYRLYSVEALKKLPIALNSNDFHFDTEIIIQFLNAKLRIKELPIPTHYGDEVCRVDGMKYAKDVMIATANNAFHRMGLLYQRRFDTAPVSARQQSIKLGYPSSHQFAIDAVPAGAKVIDIGSGADGIAGELANKGCDVTVIGDAAHSAGYPPSVHVKVEDLNGKLEFSPDADYLLLLDVIEKLQSPEAFIEELRKKFDFKPRTLILSTPNVAFAVQRLMLAIGQFNYSKQGVLDLTHTRLFTFRGTEHLLRDAGFRIKEVRGVPAPFPKAIGDGPVARAALRLNEALIKVSKTLFAYQIYIVAESTPDVEFVLNATLRSERARSA